jgi:hypothetical protein
MWLGGKFGEVGALEGVRDWEVVQMGRVRPTTT